MNTLNRAELLQQLPALALTPLSGLAPQLQSYLKFYGLADLAQGYSLELGLLECAGIDTAVQYYQQPAKSRGTVLVVHGYMDHMGLYGHLIRHLLHQGYDVMCYDLTGHGLSAGEVLHIHDFSHYAQQLADLINQLQPQISEPLSLLGQSTGCAVIMAQQVLTLPLSLQVQQRILLAPLVRPAMWRSIKRRYPWLRRMFKQVPRKFTQCSHDLAFLTFLEQHDPLQYRQIPMSWVGAMLNFGDALEQQSALPGPVRVVQGDADKTVDWQYNLPVLQRVYPQLEVCMVPGARHHLVNESEEYRGRVFEQLFNC
ncbi:alpha/beta hydrolase [Pontibacter sp. JAM-7]|uniref:alpha/beta hydrolase n=1 Tax=Pontibacter sp. JAM-7 TaxID=3366581 RepID=UPI003AF556C1